MAYEQPDDYNTVAERIIEFRGKYPDGCLQPADRHKPYAIEIVDGKTWVIVVAAAYRGPDDRKPGIGMAYEPVPGPTTFTRGSELQNAETAAWGRAIVAALQADTKKGIASKEEVQAAEAREHREALNERNAQASARQNKPPQATVDSDKAREAYTLWMDAIQDRKGDRGALLALYNEAVAKRVDPGIIEAIKAAGNEAANQPQEGQG